MKTKNRHSRKRAADNGLKVCLVTKKTLPRKEMLRFVISPAGDVVFDVSERLPGAGFWVAADKKTLDLAVSKKLFSKAAGRSVQIPVSLSETVEKELKEYCVSLLCLARKAGLLVLGFENVKKSLSFAEVGMAFEASDSVSNRKNSLYRPTDDFPVFSFLSREELGQTTRQNIQAHVLVLKSKLADKLIQTAQKITLYTQTKG